MSKKSTILKLNTQLTSKELKKLILFLDTQLCIGQEDIDILTLPKNKTLCEYIKNMEEINSSQNGKT